MKRILTIALGLTILSFALAAQQDEPAQIRANLERMMVNAKIMSFEGGIMGPAVKGAPYSADEIRESTQVLGDGTRIHNENKVTIYRDSQGRVRRESPTEISIWDPAAGTNYVLNPKNMTARKMSLQFSYSRTGNVARVEGSGSGPGVEKGQTFSFSSVTVSNGEQPHVLITSDPKAIVEGKLSARRIADNSKKENLGTQTMEGVAVQGERVTSTIETGTIGNDRPIQSVFERWYSPDLQTYILSKRTDPRNGEEVTRLTSVHRGEPSPTLFEVPPGYTIVGKEGPGAKD